MPNQKKKSEYMLHVASLRDFTRLISIVEMNSPIFAVKRGKEYSLFAVGIDNVFHEKLACVVEVEEMSSFLMYMPVHNDTKDYAVITSDISKYASDFKRAVFPIMIMKSMPFRESQKYPNRVTVSETSNMKELVRGIMGTMRNGTGISYAFSFNYKKNRYIAAFLAPEMLFYCKSEIPEGNNFIQYDYNNDSYKSYEYLPNSHNIICVVNLEKPFDFFKC